MSIIDDSYCGFVNMDHRKDRLIHMTNQLSRVGIEADRIRGLRPSEVNIPHRRVNAMMQRTPGAIGCHFSQVEIMKRAKLAHHHAFVMEDDIIFCHDFNERVNIWTDFLKDREWDVFWLGGTFHVPAYWHPHGKSRMQPDCSANIGRDCEYLGNRFVRTYGAFCTYAYIVNYNSIDKILKLFDQHLHESIGIDWLFIKIQPQLNCFAFVPGSVKQMDNQSDIGTGITVFSGFSRLNGTHENSRYWYQERMNDFEADKFHWH